MRKFRILLCSIAIVLLSAWSAVSTGQVVVFNYTGAVQTYVVPKNVTSITVDLLGAAGGSTAYSRGGYGGRVQCVLAVTPGTELNIVIGGAGLNPKYADAAGGYNGGAAGDGYAGGGGGASDLRIGGLALSNRVIVAGGGGGAAANTETKNNERGGDGGGITGEKGYSNGTIAVDEMISGTAGMGGYGYGEYTSGGGGGGGYIGGGGGKDGGGNGGSSYTDPILASAVIHSVGSNTNGNGIMLITPIIPSGIVSHESTPGVSDTRLTADPVATATFHFTGAMQQYIVPEGVNNINIDLTGATGGASGFSRGGYGGRVECTLAVTPGALLYLNIGGPGHNSTGGPAEGGYNGGGPGEYYGGGGGGASDIRYGGTSLSNRIVVAGGGGGGAAVSANKDYDRGGDGGGIEGEAGYSYASNTNRKGGAGGSSISAKAVSPNHAEISREYSGGGGGGGYFPGEGSSCGGGGGSSYADPMLGSPVIHTRGYNHSGAGSLTIRPILPEVATEKTDDNNFKPHGSLSGQVFSDFAYKAHADTILEGRSGISQYARVPTGMSMFQFRRVTLGYNYEMSTRFSTEFMLAAEDDYDETYNQSTGDLLLNNKLAPFIKLANLRWKNIFKGSDIVIGQCYTPAFHHTSEDVWAYRSIARTLTDIYRTSEYDMGVSLQGHLPNNSNLGYNLMIGNGTGATPETNQFKWFYGDVYYKLFNKRVIVDFYADYQKLTWTPTWHRDRQMDKVFVAYSVPKFTIGLEIFTNRLMGDDIATKTDGVTKDTLTTRRTAYSLFVRGRIYSEKLGFFARYDKYSWKADNANKIFESYDVQTTIYDHNTIQEFVTFGIDYAPFKNVHIMPNVYYHYFENISPSSIGNGNKDYDLVYRLTLSYQFNK